MPDASNILDVALRGDSRGAPPQSIAVGTAPTSPLLEARGLVFEVGGNRLIDGLNLTLGSKGRCVVLGPNGAGKSLLLRLLHGLIRPSAGSVQWRGAPLDSAARDAQAMVFQRPVLLRRSVEANLRYALKVHGTARNDLAELTEFWLDRADLSALAKRPARLLSGGEQQRLAVVRALCGKPALLFLDEPTASLDPASMLTIERLIDEAHTAGTRIVLVTHDLGQARRLADEVIFVYRGRVEEQGPAKRFFDCPTSDKARAFIEGRIVI